MFPTNLECPVCGGIRKQDTSQLPIKYVCQTCKWTDGVPLDPAKKSWQQLLSRDPTLADNLKFKDLPPKRYMS